MKPVLIPIIFAPLTAIFAAALYVSPTGTGDCSMAAPCGLGSAMSAAGNGDVILLAEGNYTSATSPVLTIDQNVTLMGGWDGLDSTTPSVSISRSSVIDGQSLNQGIEVAADLDVTLFNLDVSNCRADAGAGLLSSNASLTLNYVTFSDNTAVTSGGAIKFSSGRLEIDNGTFSGNSVSGEYGSGGAIDSTEATDVVIDHSSFVANHSYGQLAVSAVKQNTFTLRNSLFDGNFGSSPVSNAVVFASGVTQIQGIVYIQNCQFLNNNLGGLVVAIASSEVVEFVGNRIAQNIMASSTLDMQGINGMVVSNNMMVDNNMTGTYGSVVSFRSFGMHASNYVFNNNTLADNGIAGRGISLSDANLTAANNIIADVPNGVYGDIDSMVELHNTLWSNVDVPVYMGIGSASSDGDISADPRFVNAAGGNYHLQADSPAIGNALCLYAPSLDFDGDDRTSDGTCDIGADEFVPSVSPALLMYLLN